jgi:hypothetical protein
MSRRLGNPYSRRRRGDSSLHIVGDWSSHRVIPGPPDQTPIHPPPRRTRQRFLRAIPLFQLRPRTKLRPGLSAVSRRLAPPNFLREGRRYIYHEPRQ